MGGTSKGEPCNTGHITQGSTKDGGQNNQVLQDYVLRDEHRVSGCAPYGITNGMYAEVHEEISAFRDTRGHATVPPQVIGVVKHRARIKMMNWWKEWLSSAAGSNEITRAIRPHLDKWSGLRVGFSFHATQVLSGHGYFGRYLRRIGKENTERCWQCGAPSDTARHTLNDCPAWNRQREDLKSAIGQDLAMPAIVRALLTKDGRRAFLSFCRTVMLQKERDKRARERHVNDERGAEDERS